MPSLRQKPSGRWEARYRDPSGIMRARTFSTKREAREWVKEIETDVRRGDWIDPRLSRTTFAEWADEYQLTIVHLRSITRSDYTRIVDIHLLPAFGEWPISQIEQVDVRRFIADKQAAGLAPKTLQKIRLVLRQILETARGSGAIKSNPCDGIRMPRSKQADPTFLTPDEVERLARATRPPYDVLVRMAAVTGMRPSELCGLQVGRLNLVAGTVDVVDALTVVRGHVELGPTKNGVRRTVGLTRALCDDLAKHLAARAQELDRPLEPDDFVFVAPQGGPLRRDLLYKRIFVPAVNEAGLRPGLRLHDLRHTCASLLIQLGAHPKVIQEWLGHRSITVTMDVYGHLYPSLNEALTQRLDAVFAQARAAEPVTRSVTPIRNRR